MKFRIVFAITGFVWLGANELQAQTYSEEALMISRTQPGGTARIQGMGGAQNAIGGDLSSAYYNPAGLGMYNRSDFSITPGYTIANTSSSYLGNTTSDGKNSMIVPNFGIAFNNKKDGSKGIWGGTFAINFNRINDYNSTFSYKGTNPDNSIIDYFVNKSNGRDTTQFLSNGALYNTPTELGYDNYLFDSQKYAVPPGPSNMYFTPISGIPTQTETVKTTGAQNQWSFSYGVNFNDKFFLGGGVGFTSLNFKANKTYVETFDTGGLAQMQLNESLTLSGTGINATIGTIIRPVDKFQVGLSIATPTSYSVIENYSASMSSNWRNSLGNMNFATDQLSSVYNLTTPWRFSGGIAFFIEKHGFISADAEFLDYGATKYSSDTDDWSADNKEIKGLFKSTLNIRIGGEYRFGNYRFRGGYSMRPDPYQTEQNSTNQSISSFSTGVGYRTSKFYVDLAGVFGQNTAPYGPYQGSPLVSVKNTPMTFLLTIGFPF